MRLVLTAIATFAILAAAPAPAQWGEITRFLPPEVADELYEHEIYSMTLRPNGTTFYAWLDRIPVPGFENSYSLAIGTAMKPPGAQHAQTLPTIQHPGLFDTPAYHNEPVVHASPTGTVLLCYPFAEHLARYELAVRRWEPEPAAWGGALLLPPDPRFQQGRGGLETLAPVLESDGAGTWIAAWQTRNTFSSGAVLADTGYSVSHDDGTSWTTPRRLPLPELPVGFLYGNLVLKTDRQGTWIAAAAGQEANVPDAGKDYQIWTLRSTDAGETWSAPVRVDFGPGGQTLLTDDLPALATDGNGNWVVLFGATTDALRSVPTNLWAARSEDGGATWSTADEIPLPYSTFSAFRFPPKAEFDAYGNLLATASLHLGEVQPPFLTVGVYSFVSGDLGRTWGPAIPAAGPAPFDIFEPPTAHSNDSNPKLFRTGPAEWFIGWQGYTRHFSESGGYVVAYDYGSPRYTTGTLTLDLSAEPALLDFDQQVHSHGSSPPRTVTIRLPEETLGTARPVSLALSDGFELVGELDATPILPGEERVLQIAFDPSETRDYEGALTVFYENPDASVTVPLSGVGVPPFHGLVVGE